MKKQYKEFLKDRFLVKISFFIILTATMLYVAFFIVKDYEKVARVISGFFSSIIRALSPLWIGLVLAYMLNPLVNLIDKKILRNFLPKDKRRPERISGPTKSRFISIFITYSIIFLAVISILYGFASLINGKLVFDSFSQLGKSLLNTIASYQEKLKVLISQLPDGAFSEQLQGAAKWFLKWISSTFNAGTILSTVTGLGSVIFNFFIGIIISIYLIADKEFFLDLWNKILYLCFPNKHVSIRETLSELNTITSRFVRGVFLDATIVGVLCVTALSIAKVEFALFLGIFAGITNVIPYFGPFIGMIPAFAVGFFTDGIWKGIAAVIAIFIVQQIDANLLYPKIVGSSTGLRAMFVLLAVIVFGYYFGILGMILAVPIASMIQLFIVRWARKRELRIKKEKLQERLNGNDG